MGDTLYEQLRGEEGISQLVDRIVDKHLANPVVGVRFANGDLSRARTMGKEFFAAGSGAPIEYTGKSMLEAHTGMNISEQEYLAVVDDIIEAMEELGYELAVRNEVLAIAYSLKGDIIRV